MHLLVSCPNCEHKDFSLTMKNNGAMVVLEAACSACCLTTQFCADKFFYDDDWTKNSQKAPKEEIVKEIDSKEEAREFPGFQKKSLKSLSDRPFFRNRRKD